MFLLEQHGDRYEMEPTSQCHDFAIGTSMS